MARSKIEPGSHGEITFQKLPDGRVRGTLRYRRIDGGDGKVRVRANSDPAARRSLPSTVEEQKGIPLGTCIARWMLAGPQWTRGAAMSRILVSAMPFSGHIAPMSAVAGALVARGHDVRFYTGGAFRQRVEASGARFVPWWSAPDFDENDLQKTFPRLVGKKGLRQVFTSLEDVFINTAPAQVADLKDEWARERWDVIVSEEMSVGVSLFAELLDCPRATVTVVPLNIRVSQGPPSGIGLTPGRNFVTKARDAALRAAVPLFSGPLQAPIARARAAVGLTSSRPTFEQTVFSRQLVTASGGPSLDFDRGGRPDELHFVGMLAVPTAAAGELPAWWGDLQGRTVVHVTQGTLNIDPTDLIRPALEALADRDLIVAVSTGVRGHDELPFPVPPNARVAGLLPYAELMPLVDVMVTNGGWGGTLTALSHGIPLVIAGGDLDKPEIAARVAWTGAGVNLRTGTPKPAQVARGVERVMTDASYREAAARVGVELRALGGAARTAELVETLLGPTR